MLGGADKKPWNWPFVAKKSRTSVKKNDDDIAEGDEAGASVDGAGSWVGESDPSGVLSFSWHIAFACLIGVPHPPPRCRSARGWWWAGTRCIAPPRG